MHRPGLAHRAPRVEPRRSPGSCAADRLSSLPSVCLGEFLCRCTQDLCPFVGQTDRAVYDCRQRAWSRTPSVFRGIAVGFGCRRLSLMATRVAALVRSDVSEGGSRISDASVGISSRRLPTLLFLSSRSGVPSAGRRQPSQKSAGRRTRPCCLPRPCVSQLPG